MLTVNLVNPGSLSFTYPEYPSLAISKVWAGKADLPSTTELWRRYDKVVKDRGGYGKYFQFLSDEQFKSKIFVFTSLVEIDIFSRSCIAIFHRLAQR